jgi:hypothetical protein
VTLPPLLVCRTSTSRGDNGVDMDGILDDLWVRTRALDGRLTGAGWGVEKRWLEEAPIKVNF